MERRAADGLHVLLISDRAQYRLWLPQPLSIGQPVSAVLPLGADALFGVAAAMQFWRHVTGASVAPLRRQDRRMKRVHLSLRALDGRNAGASYRTLAEWLFGAGRVATESWRTSSLRDATIRLVRSGSAMAGGEYRRLLRQRIEE